MRAPKGDLARSFAIVVFTALIALSLASCDLIYGLLGINKDGAPPGPPPSPPPVYAELGVLPYQLEFEPTPAPGILMSGAGLGGGQGQGFESGSFDSGWTAAVTDLNGNPLASPSPLPEVDSAEAHWGSYAAVFASRYLSPGIMSLSLSVDIAGPANLRFRYKTDICGTISGTFNSGEPYTSDTWFRFFLDDSTNPLLEAAGFDIPWKIADIAIPAGSHTLTWCVEKGNGIYYTSASNSVWLDDIMLCPDEATEIVILPRGEQECPLGQEALGFLAWVLRGDGSIKADMEPALSVLDGTGDGSLNPEGRFTGTVPGGCLIQASAGGFTAQSGIINVLPADYLDEPILHAGRTYTGKTGPGSGSASVAPDPGIVISSPTEASFSADAFFTLRGYSTYTGADQYILVRVSKGTDSTSYYLRGNFARRIWLRFGSGIYTVTIHRMHLDENILGYQGDIGRYTYYSPVYSYQVSNDNADAEDGRFLYPSDPLQADDIAIRNLSRHLVHGLDTDEERQRAIHDYVVRLLHYDDDSLIDGRRKKQDALSVLANGMGVCEGYTSLFGALARAAGIRVKAAIGYAGNPGTTGPSNHAWNLVDNGAGEAMIDCTWDDPGPYDASPDNISWKYFLCDITGVEADHAWAGDRQERGLVTVSYLRGWPLGWY